MRFGEYVKALRTENKQSLRSFCLEHNFDPGNHSKIERSLHTPKGNKQLKKLAYALGLKENSDKWIEFFNLSSIENGQIPEYIMSDKEVLKKLPVLFRTIKGEKISPEKLESLINKIKES